MRSGWNLINGPRYQQENGRVLICDRGMRVDLLSVPYLYGRSSRVNSISNSSQSECRAHWLITLLPILLLALIFRMSAYG